APTADGPFDRPHHSKSMGGAGNICGTPAIVIPTGLTKGKLPTAIQLDGRAYSENRLVAIAHAFQAITDWHRAHPDLSSR
ncbi:amidase, partial [Singulisphaera rosea]